MWVDLSPQQVYFARLSRLCSLKGLLIGRYPARQREEHVAHSGTREVTALLQAWAGGDVGARDRLFSRVYDDLRRRASHYLRRERPDHSLQPNDLVHEAYLRLTEQRRVAWLNRSQFFGIASQMMRRILVDRARARQAAKRSGTKLTVTLDDRIAQSPPHSCEVLALDRALTELSTLDPRQARLVELRYFGGLSLDETATLLEISPTTVKREWRIAKAWLYRRLSMPAISASK
jgi:RNA polymerase sigma factor (TIGR02999 family)